MKSFCHPVDKANATFLCSNGQMLSLHMLSAHNLGDLPLRIYSRYPPQTFLLALSSIQTVRPAEELFLPPAGFTKYESEAVMLDELRVRQANVFKRKRKMAVGTSITTRPGLMADINLDLEHLLNQISEI